MLRKEALEKPHSLLPTTIYRLINVKYRILVRTKNEDPPLIFLPRDDWRRSLNT